MRFTRLFPVVALSWSCSGEGTEPPATGPVSGGSGIGGAAGAAAGTGAQAGTTAGSAGAGGKADAGAGGTSSGLAGGENGGADAGTASAAGAATAGSTASGGSAGQGGAGGSAGSGGTAGGDSDVAKALDGVRIDAPCAGTPAGTDGETCNHTVLMGNAFQARKEVSLGGSPGTVYDVTVRVRGVVEPTSVNGGARPDTTTIVYKNSMWRKLPYTIGGSVKSPDYQPWKLSVEEPKQDYFLNDYQQTAHYVFELDYEVTIPMAGGTKVTLDVTDSNEREIVNYEKYALDGIPGSMNLGQFVQLKVVSVKPR